jgi:tetratricopeptide (TPR) repeat protein
MAEERQNREEDGLDEVSDEALEFEDDKESKDGDSDNKSTDDASKKKKKLIIIIAGAVGALLIILGVVLALVLGGDEEESEEPQKSKVSEKITQVKDKQEDIPKTKLDEMIKKANMLYEKGYKKEALELFDTISSYSESLSYYNIGVAHMKEENYQAGLEAFKVAIRNTDNICVSAINSAVCALAMKDVKLFEYYIDLAHSNLPKSIDDPLYKYYYALIRYYKGEYLESLSALKKENNPIYKAEQNHIKANLAILFNDNISAIEALESIAKRTDYLTLGLLFAREGMYDMAIKYLKRAELEYPDNRKVKLALGLIYTKIGDMNLASSYTKDLYEKAYNKPLENYPITVFIKDSIFDKNRAQEDFAKRLNLSHQRVYNILFYFAPYKIFNSNKTIGYIRKGNKSIYIDAISDAKNIYKKGTVSAKVNSVISRAIKLATNYHIRDANKLLSSIINEFPDDSILHYNLALSYAQMQIYHKAYEHFSKSFHLDPSNSLSGVFGLMSAELAHVEHKKFKNEVRLYLGDKKVMSKTDEFHLVLMNFVDGNYQSASRWLDENEQKSLLANAFEVIVAGKLEKETIELQKAEEFKKMLNDDIVANILYVYIKNRKLSNKDFAKKAGYFLKEHKMFLDSLYYGPVVVKEMYITLANIAGMTYVIRDILKERVMTEVTDVRGVMQSLALTDIYLNFFEEAYTLYNKLIDDLKEDDSHTLFLAAVAAIGANHHSSAITLLELANLTDKLNYESRYALGLLYLEAKNLEAAGIQFDKIKDDKFESNFFDFDIRKKD